MHRYLCRTVQVYQPRRRVIHEQYHKFSSAKEQIITYAIFSTSILWRTPRLAKLGHSRLVLSNECLQARNHVQRTIELWGIFTIAEDQSVERNIPTK